MTKRCIKRYKNMTNQMNALEPNVAELLNGGQTETIEETITEPSTNETIVDDGSAVEGDNGEVTVASEPDKVHIEGFGDFTVDELKEFRNGYLRQSDYTRKTQDLARQREEAQDALEVYEYLKDNPHLVNALMQMNNDNTVNSVVQKATPENAMMQQILHNQKAIEIELKLNDLKSRYGNDVDEVALFQKATELKTDDLEFVYKALQYDNLVAQQSNASKTAIDNMKAEIEANKAAVSTIVGTNQGAVARPKATLTAAEKKVAAQMGISEADYLKWK